MTITEAQCPSDARWRKSSYSTASNACVEVATWRKSSHSNAGNNCVEVAQTAAVYAVRDSKNPEAGQLTFCEGTWQAFVADVKHSSYDL